MRIAFTSCLDAIDAPQQPVWAALAAERPEVLLLLGDTIYMDYGPSLGWPKAYSLKKFAREMHRRYAAQWAVPGWRAALQQIKVRAAIWDDHDYAWELSHGAGEGSWRVPDDKHRISRALFRQFSDCLNTLPTQYPACPPLATLLQEPLAGIRHAFVHRGVQFLMVDGRSHREPKPNNWQDLQRASQIGQDQRNWLMQQHQAHGGVSVLASGSTLTRSGDSWDDWSDCDWLREVWAPRQLLVLSGDIHDNRYIRHTTASGALHECTSSGAARPGWGGVVGHFGVVELQGATASARWFGPKAVAPQTFTL